LVIFCAYVETQNLDVNMAADIIAVYIGCLWIVAENFMLPSAHRDILP